MKLSSQEKIAFTKEVKNLYTRDAVTHIVDMLYSDSQAEKGAAVQAIDTLITSNHASKIQIQSILMEVARRSTFGAESTVTREQMKQFALSLAVDGSNYTSFYQNAFASLETALGKDFTPPGDTLDQLKNIASSFTHAWGLRKPSNPINLLQGFAPIEDIIERFTVLPSSQLVQALDPKASANKPLILTDRIGLDYDAIALHPHFDAILELIAKRAEDLPKDILGNMLWKLLLIAAKQDNIQIADSVFRHFSFDEEFLNLNDNDKFIGFAEVCKQGNVKVVERIIDAGIPLEKHPMALRYACDSNLSEVAALLIDRGMDVNTVLSFTRLNLECPPLYVACLKGYQETVDALVARGADVEQTNEKKDTLLHIACKRNDVKAAEMLIALEANLEAYNADGRSPLEEACLHGSKAVAELVNNALKTKGLEGIDQTDITGKTFLHKFAEEGNVKAATTAIAIGADKLAKNNMDHTPLFVACVNGKSAIVQLLNKHKAGVVDTVSNGTSLLHFFSATGNITAVKAIFNADPHNTRQNNIMRKMRDNNKLDSLYLACANGHQDVAEYISTVPCDRHYYGSPPTLADTLYLACKEDDFKAAETAIKTRPGIVNEEGERQAPLHNVCRQGKVAFARFLLERGAKVNLRSRKETPLHIACEKNDIELMELLLRHKAFTEVMNQTEETPLYIACEKENIEAAELLLNMGADPDQKCRNGQTPLHITCEKNNIKMLELLLKNRAILQQEKAEEERISDHKPLLISTAQGSIEAVRLLLQHGANANSNTEGKDDVADSDGVGKTALYIACRDNNLDLAKLLLEHNANPNVLCEGGQTALHVAAAKGNLELVQTLLLYGADPKVRDQNKSTPLQEASKHGHGPVIKELLKTAEYFVVSDKERRSCIKAAKSNGIGLAKSSFEENSKTNVFNRFNELTEKIRGEKDLTTRLYLIDNASKIAVDSAIWDSSKKRKAACNSISNLVQVYEKEIIKRDDKNKVVGKVEIADREMQRLMDIKERLTANMRKSRHIRSRGSFTGSFVQQEVARLNAGQHEDQRVAGK